MLLPGHRPMHGQCGEGDQDPYQVVLGLALHLQGVHRAPQLQDLRLAALQLLGAGRGLQADALGLKHKRTETRSPPGQRAAGLPRPALRHRLT